MKILVVHNRYQKRGGEDVVFEAETTLLRDGGHTVLPLSISNDEINSLASRVTTTFRVADNPAGKKLVANAIDSFRPDIVHVHNFFPLLSPAVFDVCRDKAVPAVVTLHNFRTICTGGMLLRNGQPCEKCLDSGNIWGVLHRCYRGSLPGSLASAYMVSTHQRRHTWTRPGLRIIALTGFARDKFVRAGFDASMIDVKPNCVVDPGEPDNGSRQGLVYVGRLSPEKGIDILLSAVAKTGVPLRIAGDGPELPELRKKASANVTFLGHISPSEVVKEISAAKALVVPSLWYEGFPMVVAEAFACGTPVIASDLGALAEIIQDDNNGMLYPPGNVNTLSKKIDYLFGDSGVAERCGTQARASYLRAYTPSENLRLLEDIYFRALNAAK